MKIYAIRHGLTELNKKGLINGHLEDDLAIEGVEQAIAAAPLLPTTIKRIYSSSLRRARQTAEILNDTLDVDISFHPELAEVNFGNLNGTTFTKEYQDMHMSQKYDWRFYYGESVEDVKKRVLMILREMARDLQDGEGLIVTHGGIIRLLHLLQTGNLMGEIGNTSLHSFDLDLILIPN